MNKNMEKNEKQELSEFNSWLFAELEIQLGKKSTKTIIHDIDVALDCLLISNMTNSSSEVCQNCALGSGDIGLVDIILPETSDELLCTLKIVDIVARDKSASPVFSPSIKSLVDVAHKFPLFYQDKLITEIDVPTIGCERFNLDEIDKLECVNSPVRDNHRSGYIMGVREKRDGVMAVVFNITLITGEKYAFYWDDEYIESIPFASSSLFEKTVDCYYQLSGEPIGLLKGKDVIQNVYYLPNQKTLLDSREGVVVLIDGVEYKVPRQKTITLRREGSLYVDNNGVGYSVAGKSDARFADFVVFCDSLCFIRDRHDKSCADSTKAITFVRKYMATTLDILTHFPRVDPVPIRQNFVAVKCAERRISDRPDKQDPFKLYYYHHKTYKRYKQLTWMINEGKFDVYRSPSNRDKYYCYGSFYNKYCFKEVKCMSYKGSLIYNQGIPSLSHVVASFRTGNKCVKIPIWIDQYMCTVIVEPTMCLDCFIRDFDLRKSGTEYVITGNRKKLLRFFHLISQFPKTESYTVRFQ